MRIQVIYSYQNGTTVCCFLTVDQLIFRTTNIAFPLSTYTSTYTYILVLDLVSRTGKSDCPVFPKNMEFYRKLAKIL